MAKRNVYLSLSFSSVPFEAVEQIMDAAEEVGAAFTIHIDDEIVAEPEEKAIEEFQNKENNKEQ